MPRVMCCMEALSTHQAHLSPDPPVLRNRIRNGRMCRELCGSMFRVLVGVKERCAGLNGDKVGPLHTGHN